MLNYGEVVGIMGGGQLGYMLAEVALSLGYNVCIFTNDRKSPACRMGVEIIVAEFDDLDALDKFVKNVKVVVLEFENIPHICIKYINKYIKIFANYDALYIAKNRLREKECAVNCGVDTVLYSRVRNVSDLKMAVEQLGLPILLKIAEYGYDGKGQRMLRTIEDLEEVVLLDGVEYVAEQFVNLDREFSIIVARDQLGDMEFFPVADNVHIDGILRTSTVPSSIDRGLLEEANHAVVRIAHKLKLVGLLAVEFFVVNGGKILFNEMAPRPHNSGHWSLNACNVSQFEQLVRVAVGMPLRKVYLLSGCTMKNIIGYDINNLTNYILDDNACLKLYGKTEVRESRKMGHVNLLTR